MEFRSIRPLRVLMLLLLGTASVGSAPVEIKAPRRAEVEWARRPGKEFERLSPEQREKLRQAFGMVDPLLPFRLPARRKTPSLADLLKEFSEPAPVTLKPQLRRPERLGTALHKRLENRHPSIDSSLRPEGLGTALRQLLENSIPNIDSSHYLAGAIKDRKPPDVAEIRTVQILLNQIGYYSGRPDGIAGPQTRRAVQRFHDASGRWSDGSLDRPTITALFLAGLKDNEHMAPEIRPEAEKRLSDCLAKIGFTDIAKFEAFNGLPQTGQIVPEVVSRVEDDLKLQDEITSSTLEMLVLGLTPEQHFSRRDEVFGFLQDDSQQFLLAHPNTPELWVLDDQGQVVRRMKGPAGVEQFYEAGRHIAAAHSDDRALFLYASPAGRDGNGTIALQIGREATTVPRAEFDDFVQSGGRLSKLEEAIETGTGERRALFVLDSGIFWAAAESGGSTTRQARPRPGWQPHCGRAIAG